MTFPPRGTCLGAAALAVALALVAPPSAEGKPTTRTSERYLFSGADVQLAKGVPSLVTELVRTQLRSAIEAHDLLLLTLPEGAPDPVTSPVEFKSYLKKNKIRAFKVNLEVTSYSHELEPLPEPRKGQRLSVSIAVHAFGETIPDRVMAFSGEGSATIKMDIGRRLRDRDTEVANHDAAELAIAEALERSIIKLKAPPPTKGKPGKK